MADTEPAGGGATEEKDLTVLERILEKGRMIRDPQQEPHARDVLNGFVEQVLAEATTMSGDVLQAINDRIKQLDELITAQLREVMHHPDFQKLESSWRGLHYLVMNTETSTRLKIRLLNASKDELLKDMEKATEFDQSNLFKMVYEDEYGTFGGHPYSCLIGDFDIKRHPQDFAFLRKIAEVAAAAHAPFIAAAGPSLFDMDGFTDLMKPRDLSKTFESLELIEWRAFRESEDSRYVTLCLPRFLLRLPYGKMTIPVEGMEFEEFEKPLYSAEDLKDNPKLADRNPPAGHEKFLWGNPAWLLGQRITNAFALYGWTAAIRGVEGGGKVEGLATYTFYTDEGDLALQCPTEIAITDRREKEISDQGFISLCHCKGTNYAAFFGGQTTNKPKIYNLDTANANARLSAMLPYLLNASRFAHYLKVMMRDKIGSFMTAGNVSDYLNTWIKDFVLLDDNAQQSVKAQYPLREARVDVTEVPGKPGVYNATVFLRPHFQLEELTASIRLVAELPPPAA